MISWTPYAIVSLTKAFFNVEFDPITSFYPAMYAKTSLVWPAFFFLVTNKSIHSKFLKWYKNNSVLNISIKFFRITKAEQV